MRSSFYMLCSAICTFTVLMTFPGNAVDVKKSSSGYSSSQSVKVTEFPSRTTTLYARTQVECIVFCTQQTNCLQVYFNRTTSQCSMFTTGKMLTTTTSTEGRLLTIPNPMVRYGRSCSSVHCSPGSVCLTDTFGEAMCAADNAQCSQDTHIIKVKSYYTGIYIDDLDDGIVHTVIFNKTLRDTALRVLWFSTTRAHYHNWNSCGRYYITFNGSQCENPGNIDFSNYDASYNDDHHLSELDGICYGLADGVVNVSIVVGACPGFTVTDSMTGWNAGRSMWVYELNTANTTAYSECSNIPLINTQYYTIWNLSSELDPDNQLTEIMYQKVSSGTILRVKWQGTARIEAPLNNGWCGRWYITVNGSECNPRAEFILGMFYNTYYYAEDNHKTRTLEGFCYGLQAGTYMVALRIGSCFYATDQPNAFTGGYSVSSRMTLSEVRLATTTQAVTNADGKIIKIPFFNFQHWSWYLLNSYVHLGTILSVTYTKISDTSGLRLRAVGLASVAGAYGCCRWYFTINGTECTNPGPIEGVAYNDIPAEYLQPSVLDGVCYGLLSGSYYIGYNVGQCPHYGVSNCITGWGSTVHIIIKEAQPDFAVSCANPLLCP